MNDPNICFSLQIMRTGSDLQLKLELNKIMICLYNLAVIVKPKFFAVIVIRKRKKFRTCNHTFYVLPRYYWTFKF